MKTLVTTTLIVLITINLSYAQNHLGKNEIQVESIIQDELTTINWTSNKEVNTSYYLVERSEDGVNFYTIAKLNAGSSTYTPKSYSYEDTERESTASLYRVTLVFMDGQSISVLSETTSELNMANAVGK